MHGSQAHTLPISPVSAPDTWEQRDLSLPSDDSLEGNKVQRQWSDDDLYRRRIPPLKVKTGVTFFK